MDLGTGLLDDAGPAEGAVARWRHHRAAAYADLVGALVVPDTGLVRVGRAALDVGSAVEVVAVEVAVVVAGGAGGLVAVGRPVPGVRLTAAYATLRDLDDLAGNARRVVAAAAELDGVEVAVGLPAAPGWEAAVDEVEAAGLLAAVAAGPQLAEQLHVLVEADLAYRVLPGPDGPSVVQLLAATAVLIEASDVEEARRVLGDLDAAAAVLDALPSGSGPRLRRRFRATAVGDVTAAATSLASWV